MAPSKRKSQDLDTDSDDSRIGSKRQKNLENDTQKLRAGIIHRIYIQNFMCHSALEVSLNSSINFIVGRNGSGKSAILTAVVVALGCKASSTNRGTSLKNFVKKGSHSAMIQVTLCNAGLHAYKPNVYGNKITIIRTIYSGSGLSAYKIKSASGETISTKRDELHKIITAFNIQVDNPISILNQDTARTFLATSDPKAKYSIFMKATRLEDVTRLHKETLQVDAHAQTVLRRRKEDVKERTKEVEELERRWKKLHKAQNIRDQMNTLENEYFWAVAIQEEKNLALLDKERDKLESVLPEKQDIKEKHEMEEKIITDKLRELEAKFQDTRRQVEDVTAKMADAKQQERTKKEQYVTNLQKYKTVCRKIAEISDDINTLKEGIKKFKNSNHLESVRRRNEIQTQIDALTQKLAGVEAMHNSNAVHFEKLQAAHNHSQEALRQLRMEKQSLQQNIERKQGRLRALEAETDNLSVYGNWMTLVCRSIDEAHRQGRFVRKPLGPIGAFLKVDDPAWTPAIEGLFGGGFLKSFCCHCAKDSNVLNAIFKQCIPNERAPGVLVSGFQDKVHNIQNDLVVAPGFRSLYETLVISDPNIANCLIDQRGIEGILLITTTQEACHLMSNERNVPRNCKRALVMKGDTFMPYPDYKTYAGGRNRVQYLQASKIDFIRNLREEIATDQQSMDALDIQVSEKHEEVAKHKQEINAASQKKQELIRIKHSLSSEINTLSDKIEPESANINTLETELQELEKKSISLRESEDQLDKETESLKRQCADARHKFAEIERKCFELESSKHSNLSEISSQNEKVRRVGVRVRDADEELKAQHELLKRIDVRIKNQKEKTKKSVAEATLLCARVNTERSVADVSEELQDCKSYVDTIEKETGSLEEVGEALHEKKQKLLKTKKQMTLLQSGLKVLNKSLKSRRNLYYLVRKVMALKVMYMFQPLLLQRGYKGDIQFHHHEKVLHVKASPANEKKTRETKSLSGGERSYSTVAFILSLWDCVEPPFYFLDEFDVFMDKVNRRVIVELLLYHARQKNEYQYVFLTPQDTSSVTSTNDTTIHQLDDPERSMLTNG